jgi:hypothetical protein
MTSTLASPALPLHLAPPLVPLRTPGDDTAGTPTPMEELDGTPLDVGYALDVLYAPPATSPPY